MKDDIKKIPVVSFDFDLITRETTNKHESYLWADEEKDCINFHNFDGTGAINVCIGNEPYSCHRAKKEGLCHTKKG